MTNFNVSGQLNFNSLTKGAKQLLVDLIYPVGSIYLAIDNSKSPEVLFGGTWQQLESGYALWCTTNGNGEKIQAGLPNITGVFKAYSYDTTNPVGAFTARKESEGVSGGSGRVYDVFNFSANAGATYWNSASAGIYGNSTTVQPPAIRICAWKRTQ